MQNLLLRGKKKLRKKCIPETTVTGPLMEVRGCLVKFFIKHWISVVLPTFGGPTTTTRIGGGSKGVLSTTGICCFFVWTS